MKIRFASVMAGVATLATTGAMLLVGAGAANAAAPPFEGTDPNEVGTLAFYNASGTQVTSGNVNDSPFAAYVVGSTADTTHTKATFYFYTPKNGTAPSAFPGEQVSTSASYPITTAPAPINTATGPAVPGSSMYETLANYIADVPNTDTSTTDGYGNLYQARIKTSTNGQYQSTDIMVSGNTWTQVFPAPPAVVATTTTSLTASPNPATPGQTVTLTANETASDSTHPAGSVQFKNGSTNIGTAVAVDGTGKATTTTTTLPAGSDSLSAVFTPTDTTDYSGSTGTATENVAPATATTLSVSGNQTTAGAAATLTSTVSSGGNPVNAGSVTFTDGSTTLGTVAGSSNTTPGTFVLQLPAGFSAGQHNVVATFTPTDNTQYAASHSPTQSFYTQAPAVGACSQSGSSCTDTQYIQGTIPTGTLVISTPYSAQNPLNVGTLALNSNATEYSASADFSNITVTDARAGDLPFTLSALASNLSDGGTKSGSTINGENVGLTFDKAGQGYTLSPGYTGTVATHDNPAADPAVGPADTGNQGLGGSTPHTVATSTAGLGTTTMNGTLTLNAPTSTEAGTFQGTVVFTVG